MDILNQLHMGRNKMKTIDINEITKALSLQKDNIILNQLSDLVSRGLLVVEETQPVLVKEDHSDNIILKQQVRLTLKNIEYIEKLEKENSELKLLLSKMNELANKHRC